MIVRNHMSSPPITVSADTDFKVAMGLMQQHRIRRLPVVDGGGLLAGIVAERDLLGAADRYLQSVADVEDIMTRRVVTVARNTPVVEAASLMIGLKIGGLPVVDSTNKVLGIITETDLLKALVDMLAKPSRRVVSSRQPHRRASGAAKKRSAKKSSSGKAVKSRSKRR
ncbi:MAG TPA: CBS domain-containing protein [Casimicrobiaceae bacterium]|nr:CBS domain-containing protein [Casimicrobiaceae bacterium]